MNNGMNLRTYGNWISTVGLLLLISGLCLPAMAALGGDLNSVQDDAAHMKATVKIDQRNGYAVHEIADKNHTVVREYVSPDGRVFGVAWQGLFMPDLSQILGSYLQQYSAAVQQEHSQAPARRSRSLSIHQPGLVIETTGHMRAYSGRVYVPDLVPQGVPAEEVR